jgi:hypothetical protein
MRLQIRPGLRRAWRAPGRLQIGLDAGHGIVLDGLTAGDELVLAGLDAGCDPRALRGLASRAGVGQARADELLRTLSVAGLLVPARTVRSRLSRLPTPLRRRLAGDADVLSLVYPDGDGWHVLAQRRERSVAVVGAGRTGTALAVALAASGVGLVLVDDDARVREADLAPGGLEEQDLGRRRADAVADLVGRHAPQTRTAAHGNVRPDLVVLVGHGAVDPHRYDGLLREDVPHLAVLVRERDVVVGPLVLPGASACLRCLDLHRRDRDPEWPRLVPQLAAGSDGSPAPEETVLVAIGSALAAAQALAHLDARCRPATVDATLEVALPDGLVDVRPWSAHPACGCHWPPPRAGGGAHDTIGA